jgi:hypothetical protein
MLSFDRLEGNLAEPETFCTDPYSRFFEFFFILRVSMLYYFLTGTFLLV